MMCLLPMKLVILLWYFERCKVNDGAHITNLEAMWDHFIQIREN